MAGSGCQDGRLCEQVPREEYLQGVVGGAVVLEVGGGVWVGAVTEGARHASVAGRVVLGVQ